MKKGNIYGIAGAAGVIIVVAALVTMMEPGQKVASGNSVTLAAAKVEDSIQKATYYTVSNATTPAITIDQKSGAVYVAFFRAENGKSNMYMQRSDDAGKTVDNSRSWTPETAGNYTVKVFVWDNVSTSPVPLSEITTKYITATQQGSRVTPLPFHFPSSYSNRIMVGS